jgi:hypothetical protein
VHDVQVDLEGGSNWTGSIWEELVGVRVMVEVAHGEVEGVPSDDLMGVGGRAHARCDERVGALDSELRATKSKHVLRRGRLRKERAGGNRFPVHDDFRRVQSNVRCVNFRLRPASFLY